MINPLSVDVTLTVCRDDFRDLHKYRTFCTHSRLIHLDSQQMISNSWSCVHTHTFTTLFKKGV